MTSYPKIGTINTLPNEKQSGKTFVQCVNYARTNNNKFFVYNNNECYPLNSYDPINDSGTSDSPPVYATPSENCTDNLSGCLKTSGENFLKNELNKVDKDLETNSKEKEKLEIRKLAIENNYTIDVAKQVYKAQKEKNSLFAEDEEYQTNLNRIQKNFEAINTANKNTNMALTDKNRVLVSINADVQNKQNKISEINDRINTITQDIYFNNVNDKRREQILTILKAITGVLIFLMFGMIVYYGVKKTYPNKFNNFNVFNNLTI